MFRNKKITIGRGDGLLTVAIVAIACAAAFIIAGLPPVYALGLGAAVLAWTIPVRSLSAWVPLLLWPVFSLGAGKAGIASAVLLFFLGVRSLPLAARRVDLRILLLPYVLGTYVLALTVVSSDFSQVERIGFFFLASCSAWLVGIATGDQIDPRILALGALPLALNFYLGGTELINPINVGTLVWVGLVGVLASRIRPFWVVVYAILAIGVLFQNVSLGPLFSGTAALSLVIRSRLSGSFEHRRRQIVVTFLAATLFGGFSLSRLAGEVASESTSAVDSTKTVAARGALWAAGIKGSNFVGHGASFIEFRIGKYRGIGAAHNAFVDVLFAAGLFGLIILTFLVVRLLLTAYRTRSHYLAVPVGMFVANLVSGDILQSWQLWWALGVGAAMYVPQGHTSLEVSTTSARPSGRTSEPGALTFDT